MNVRRGTKKPSTRPTATKQARLSMLGSLGAFGPFAHFGGGTQTFRDRRFELTPSRNRRRECWNSPTSAQESRTASEHPATARLTLAAGHQGAIVRYISRHNLCNGRRTARRSAQLLRDAGGGGRLPEPPRRRWVFSDGTSNMHARTCAAQSVPSECAIDEAVPTIFR
jgi:hypothetical protein